VLRVVMIVMDLMELMAAMSHGGVTAHGSPDGSFQFYRLEAALATKVLYLPRGE
jgi:hypothetical protein